METKKQKIVRMIISNILGILVYALVLYYGEGFSEVAIILEHWEVPLSMLIVFLILIDVGISKGVI